MGNLVEHVGVLQWRHALKRRHTTQAICTRNFQSNRSHQGTGSILYAPKCKGTTIYQNTIGHFEMNVRVESVRLDM